MVNLSADAGGALPLPWLAAPLREVLATQRGHALLVHGAAGSGALAFAVTLAQAWLCEAADGAARPCGGCGSCHLVRARLHPDLLVLLPESLRRAHDWPLVDDKADADDAKRKPSRQIRIVEVRALIDWTTRTPARGRGKVALLHPAEALNVQSANALLKTLEEPPGSTRLLLTCADPAWLLPTVRSRCQRVRLPDPEAAQAAAWLAGQGVADAAAARILIQACNGRPLDALALAQQGVDAAAWTALPRAVERGSATALAGWPIPQVLDALRKICHDAMARSVGGEGRYFPPDAVPARAGMAALADWSRELDRVARHAEHPWNEGLLIESLVQSGRTALAPEPGRGRMDTLRP
ncbi:MAG: DNA polymerase III subunit delta' [Burkholderiales bacterium]|nr:DNA polymerase III subunit delta' [Burkholderiales bacterium]MDE2504669.1 DNA polymerase III subunit delta' [Burkholderiales bacterium]